MSPKKKQKEKPLYARNLSYLRNRLRLTRQDVVDQTGIPLSTYGSYEEGRAFPRWWNLTAICEVLECYDVLALLNKDLANNNWTQVDEGEAMQGLKKLELFIKQRKTQEFEKRVDFVP